MVKRPTVISTFAGCGGSSLGYKLAGFKELLAVEWDDNAVETFKLNFPGVPVYHGDIAKLTGKECMKLAGIKKGELDVLDGSPPCQGFSTAGKRKWDDPRNSLFKEYARLLNELQPKVFVMENVTGMVKGCMKQAYLTIIKTLRECGYRAKGKVLNAMYFNVPQSRQRVIIIGVRNDLKIGPSHPKPQGRPGNGNALVPELGNKRFLTWRKRGRKDTLRKIGSVPTAISRKGIFLEGRELYRDPKGIKLFFSYPDTFEFTGTNCQQIMRMGNSVPPNLMKAIAEHIKSNILFPGIKIERVK